ANTVGATLFGETSGEVERSRLRGRVRRGVRPGDECVLRSDEDDRSSASLLDQDAEGLPRGEEVASREHGEIELPVFDARLRERCARRKTRRGDEDVEAAIGMH